ncbi:hypothetical protein G5C51_39385 [Streptomyces sp. A7024]|uniref:DUF8129 domain-containing protein n=1 Tax=Streptomyces coryli TaxID=1128680 RepID=A0A6G4UCJ8_9ACTN|nr:hypothetical protein [Streptomyces coryli]NGN69939.1 hypothetical protein [Streptomyces coryli]
MSPDLPLPDYDRLPPADMAHRIRALSAAELERLIAYERAHAGRPIVIEQLLFRLRELEAGARPTGGGAAPGSVAPPPDGGSPVTPDTSAPSIHPPPHGTPDQPGRPKGDRP